MCIRDSLPDGFIGKRSGTGDNTDSAGFENVGRHDADLAVGGRIDKMCIRDRSYCVVARAVLPVVIPAAARPN